MGLYLVLMFVLKQLSIAVCLKELKIFVPEAVIMGNAATLSCQYDLDNASLYSVRWYFESEEFYRFVPKEAPPARTFPVSGINVDLTHSDATSVTLRGVTRDLTGQFQCEVSEDAPLFHTDIRTAVMQVIELPNEEPRMIVEKKTLLANDNLKATCTVGTSFPAANITWYINNKKVNKLPFQRIQYRSFEGTPTYSALELFPHCPILQEIYQNPAPFTNVVTVSCEITIFHIYHKNLQQRILLADMSSTVSPNILGWDGTKGKKNGDPDNSALTGASGYSIKNGKPILFMIISSISFLLYNLLFSI
ncbi:CLUMA_CG020318, isoform A [Clunio marinus]|uniref:CLUMA_CG020318, isoform A n=1 Tax=Clunio marinus TaxID=568069 RepID=A0A1J1J4L4_9DIPT|nr:CLUMA_CG020318, isoform A [Clunio marinus]